jgi:hypothetical protein
MADKLIPPALVGQQCKDASGNRYKIISHYGGAGTNIPEMVNLDLVYSAPFRVNRPLHYIGAMNRELFDERFSIVKPFPQ